MSLTASQVLNLSKTDVEITKGMKSQDKTVVVQRLLSNKTAEELVEEAVANLRAAAG